MNTEEITRFVSETITLYNSNFGKGYDFKKWRDSFSGTEKYEAAILIYDFIKDRNKSPSTLLWKIYLHDEQEILERILVNIVLQ